MELQGKIKVIGKTVSVGSNGFQKREVVVTVEGEYPQHILVEFTQAKCDLLDKFNVGQNVEVSINLRGREWTNPEGEVKYFNSLNGWRIKAIEESSAPATTSGNEDNLPF